MLPLNVWRQDAAKAGPRLLILGAIHGNEKCGTEAIARLWAELQAGIVNLEAGQLALVPVCNPEAYALHARFTDVNLNRVIAPHGTPTANEHHRANEICRLIDDCDILLDLHSYSAGAKPFLFLDREDDAHRAYAAALGIPDWVTGWNEAYAARGELNGGDTVSYAQSKGKTAVLIECGIHTDPAGAGVGYRAIRGALRHFGMAGFDAPALPAARVSRLSTIIAKDRAGDFTRDWQHLDRVAKGDVVARYADGEAVTAPHDGVVILPDAKAAFGNEWIYFGRDE